MVAVIGSLGKTTTARAVLAALTGDPDPAVPQNFFSFVAVAMLRIQRGQKHAVLEVGISRPGEMEKYARLLRPEVVVVTSIASEHNRSLPTLEVTRAEKAQMLRALPATGLAVVNLDDPHVRWMAEQTRARVVTYGLSPEADIRASDVVLDWPHGMRFTLHARGALQSVRIPLLGRPAIFSALSAIAVALEEGRALEPVLAALGRLRPTGLRLETVPLANGAFLLRDEFKSTLESMHAALDVLAEIPAPRRFVVFGEVFEPPGSQGPMYRELGARIAGVADRAVFLGRAYQPYAAGARRAGFDPNALVDAASDIRRAVEAIAPQLGPGDVVLLKGRASQRLDRVALALMDRTVRCEARICNALTRCDACPMLEQSWDASRVVF